MDSKIGLDDMVAGEKIRVMKAALPYLPPQGQRMLSLLTKTIELKNTMHIFHNASASSMQICSAPPVNDPMEMLKDIQAQCGPATQKKIDQIINMYVMFQMMELSQDISI